jgi:hypothetical protein
MVAAVAAATEAETMSISQVGATAKRLPAATPRRTSRAAQRRRTRPQAAKVSGNFPGSPVNLDHVFKLHCDKIVSLEIH